MKGLNNAYLCTTGHIIMVVTLISMRLDFKILNVFGQSVADSTHSETEARGWQNGLRSQQRRRAIPAREFFGPHSKRLHEKGYNGTSIQDIIEAAEVPKASSYNHFKSKQQLAIEALELYMRTVQDCMQGPPESSSIGLLRIYFERSILQHKEWGFESGCMIGNFAAEISNSEEVLRAFVVRAFDAWTKAIEDVLSKAWDKGEIPATQKPKELASYILNSYHGAVLRGKLTRDRTPYDQFLTHTFDYLLKQADAPSNRRSDSRKKR